MQVLEANGQQTERVFVRDDTARAGVQVTTNTTAVTGNFSAIQMITDTVFSVLTEPAATGQSLTGMTIKAGMVIFGTFTAYTLTSGAVRAYKI